MKRLLPVFERLAIKKPCPASWDAMEGQGATRFCGTCNKHVHDLGSMSQDAAAELISGGRVCVRVRRTATVSGGAAAVAAATVVFALSMACGPSVGDVETSAPGTAEVVETAPVPAINDDDAGAPVEIHMMGDVAME